MRHQLLLELLQRRMGLVALVNSHYKRDLGAVGLVGKSSFNYRDSRTIGVSCVRYGLDGLRHHAVIGRYHQNDKIRDLCSARTHR